MSHQLNNPTTSQGTLTLLRSLVPQRRLTDSEVRQITERQATKLRRILNISSDSFPLEAIDELPRIELRPETDMPTSAMAFWDGSNWIILVNTTEATTRQRFSVLHEFHHIVTHTTRQQMFGTTHVRHPEAERVADHFSACVLMPKLLVKRYWGQGPRTISAMSARFGVSPQAMSFRLDQLGLTDPKPRCAWDPATHARHRQPLNYLEAA